MVWVQQGVQGVIWHSCSRLFTGIFYLGVVAITLVVNPHFCSIEQRKKYHDIGS